MTKVAEDFCWQLAIFDKPVWHVLRILPELTADVVPLSGSSVTGTLQSLVSHALAVRQTNITLIIDSVRVFLNYYKCKRLEKLRTQSSECNSHSGAELTDCLTDIAIAERFPRY